MNFKKRKLNTLFASLLLGTASVSCQVFEGEKEMMAEESKIYKATGQSDSPNIIYQETFEGSDPFSFAHMQYAESYSFGTTTNPVFNGERACRFELNDTDPQASGGTRSEALFPEVSDSERWYSYNIYIPSEDYDRDSNYDIITQWHQGSGSGSPTLTFRITNGHFELEHGDDASRRSEYEIAPVVKDRWHDVVFHVVHSSGSDGLVEIWLNGDKVFEIEGGNMDRDFDLPRWKVGIYKDDWNGSETTDTDRRVLYFDNVRLGDRNASYEEMTSLGTAPSSSGDDSSDEVTEENTGSQLPESAENSLTLINTSTDQAVGSFISGATLTALDHRLSIVSGFGSEEPAEVRFDLSGASNRSNVDDAAPFSLNGDNGNGDFWYGEGLHPGDYELLVTPSYEVNGQLVEGISKLYTFTIESGSDNNISFAGDSAPEEQGTSVGGGSIESPISGSEADQLTWINTSSDESIGSFVSGATLIAQDYRLSIVAGFGSEEPAEVRFDLSGASNRSNVDDAAPFALNGDNGSGDFWYGEGLYSGDYELLVTPSYEVNGQLVEGTPKLYTFTIESGSDNNIDFAGDSAPEEQSTSGGNETVVSGSGVNYLSLINTTSDQEELTFTSGAEITAIDHRLSIVPDFGSEEPAEVRFDLSGASNRSNVDDAAPFALNGDNGSGDFWYGEGLYPGDYQLVVTPYYNVNGELVAGSAQNFDFSLEAGGVTSLN